MNNNRESVHFERFRKLCPTFPVGRIEKTERPDFLVHTDDQLIGIEHTEVFQPGPSHSGSLQAQDNLVARIIKRSEELWEETNGPSLLVQVFFDPHIKIAKQNVDRIAQSVIDTIKQVSIDPGEVTVLKRTSFTYTHFPQEVVHISIYRSKLGRAGENKWECSSVGWIPSLSPQDVQIIIDKKECKLDHYLLKCSEVWLLMVADALRVPSSVDLCETALLHRYNTRFDRLFFLWYADQKLVELHTSAV